MPTSISEGDIVTIKQIADYLKVTERTNYRFAAAKQIPAVRVGKLAIFLCGHRRMNRATVDSRFRALKAR